MIHTRQLSERMAGRRVRRHQAEHGDTVEQRIRTKALEKGVLALPGTVFLPDGGKTPYVRASFSLLDEADVEEAIKRLAAVVLEAKGA